MVTGPLKDTAIPWVRYPLYSLVNFSLPQDLETTAASSTKAEITGSFSARPFLRMSIAVISNRSALRTCFALFSPYTVSVSYTHLRAHET